MAEEKYFEDINLWPASAGKKGLPDEPEKAFHMLKSLFAYWNLHNFSIFVKLFYLIALKVSGGFCMIALLFFYASFGLDPQTGYCFPDFQVMKALEWWVVTRQLNSA